MERAGNCLPGVQRLIPLPLIPLPKRQACASQHFLGVITFANSIGAAPPSLLLHFCLSPLVFGIRCQPIRMTKSLSIESGQANCK